MRDSIGMAAADVGAGIQSSRRNASPRHDQRGFIIPLWVLFIGFCHCQSANSVMNATHQIKQNVGGSREMGGEGKERRGRGKEVALEE